MQAHFRKVLVCLVLNSVFKYHEKSLSINILILGAIKSSCSVELGMKKRFHNLPNKLLFHIDVYVMGSTPRVLIKDILVNGLIDK